MTRQVSNRRLTQVIHRGRRARRAGLAWPQPLAGQHPYPPL